MKIVCKTIVLCVVVGALVIPLSAFSLDIENVHFCPFILTPKDKLTDGRMGKPFTIKGETMFIWVDLMPDAKFVHPTRYVFLSFDTSDILKGEWWPILNGKSILYEGPTTDEHRPPRHHTVVSPFILPGKLNGKQVLVHMYPFTLSEKDKLTDGPKGKPIDIFGDTMYIWVDLLPDARFAHPTLHVLICGDRSTIIKGMWWPELNGIRIPFAKRPPNYTIVSPFEKKACKK